MYIYIYIYVYTYIQTERLCGAGCAERVLPADLPAAAKGEVNVNVVNPVLAWHYKACSEVDDADIITDIIMSAPDSHEFGRARSPQRRGRRHVIFTYL